MANPRPVQESFGQSMIDAIIRFAQSELDDVPTLEGKYLSHVADAQLRTTLAETLYGARWIYKLGLALLVRDAEQMAHVRAQLIDYASVCEGVLSDMIAHGITKSLLKGSKHLYNDTKNLKQAIKWNTGSLHDEMKRRSFHWLIEVAEEESIIQTTTATRLHWLRKERNAVHLRARTYKAFLGKSRTAFQLMCDLFSDTKRWKATNP